MGKVVTRFAPSPTGMLHIGGARTALFNYLYAKKNNGKFLLRIEDTDKERSTKEASDAILNGMKWLGLNWDQDIVLQSQNKALHLSTAMKMISEGFAYYDYNKKIEKEDGTFEFIKTETPAIRLKIPYGITEMIDEIHGKIKFQNKDIEDIILVRSNGDPTYMLSVVVDDIQMGITHVIRGDDHISNTPKQILLYNAIGAEPPVFASIPLIHDIDGKKLSKRRNAAAVEEYMKMGYLPSALISYLLQLGWSSPDCNMDILSINEAIKLFDIKDINKSAARFDFDKINHINLLHIAAMSDKELLSFCKDDIAKTVNRKLTEQDLEYLLPAVVEAKKQDNINSVVSLLSLLVKGSKITMEEKSKIKLAENKELVKKIKDFLETADYNNFKESINSFLESNKYKLGAIAPILRSMLIGKTDSIGIFFIISILGKEEILRRIKEIKI